MIPARAERGREAAERLRLVGAGAEARHAVRRVDRPQQLVEPRDAALDQRVEIARVVVGLRVARVPVPLAVDVGRAALGQPARMEVQLHVVAARIASRHCSSIRRATGGSFTSSQKYSPSSANSVTGNVAVDQPLRRREDVGVPVDVLARRDRLPGLVVERQRDEPAGTSLTSCGSAPRRRS